jgi:predicted transcriptional regulator YheO
VTQDNQTQSPPLKKIKPQSNQNPLNSLHPVLDGIRQIMPSLAQSLGSEYELVLHDFQDVRHSIVAIEGSVTGRSVGGPLTDLILQIIRKEETPPDLVKYPGFTLGGKELISSTIFLRNEAGKVIGCLCFNREVNRLKMIQSMFNDYLEAKPLEDQQMDKDAETFVQDVEELLMGTINEVITIEAKPIEFMTKTDKIRVVQILDNRGIFLIRSSVQTVARALNVSRYTIYNYLEEVRQTGVR